MDVHLGPTRSRTAPMGKAETYRQLLPPLVFAILSKGRRRRTFVTLLATVNKKFKRVS